jgi:hypothetical protein
MRLAHLLIQSLSSTSFLLDGRPSMHADTASSSARRLAPSSVDDSPTHQSPIVDRRKAVWSLVGGLLSPIVVVPLTPATAAGAAATTPTSKVQGPSNKRIGGLASKIRSVCNVMVSPNVWLRRLRTSWRYAALVKAP